MSHVFKRLISGLNHSFLNCRMASWRHLLFEASSLPQLFIRTKIFEPENSRQLKSWSVMELKITSKRRSPQVLSNFKVTRLKKSSHLTQIGRFRTVTTLFGRCPISCHIAWLSERPCFLSMSEGGHKCLKEAAVADTTRQDIASFTSVEFFINKYPQLLRNIGCQSQDLERV